jgi:hypothetical protein
MCEFSDCEKNDVWEPGTAPLLLFTSSVVLAPAAGASVLRCANCSASEGRWARLLRLFRPALPGARNGSLSPASSSPLLALESRR